MKVSILKGKTSKLQRVFIPDSTSTDGDGLTGLVFNSAGLVCHYIREGQAAVQDVALVTMVVGTWASGGFIEVDPVKMPGIYEVGLPDAALASATGVDSVLFCLRGAANMPAVYMEIELEGVNRMAGINPLIGTVDAAPAPTTTTFTTVETLPAGIVGMYAQFATGPATGVPQRISAYNTGTRLLTVASAFPAAPAAGNIGLILGRSS
jgi:hypothetical protein